jgi:EmrB/QacA subfamily drug resistance transporter
MNQEYDYSRKWYVMAAIAMSLFLATIDSSIVNVALPTLVRELNTNFATVQWVVLSYLLTQATLMLSMGRLGDMMGKKPIYIAGTVVFTVGSVLCGLAPNVIWLIIFRVIQAIGAAMALTLGLAIATEAFPPNERGKALGTVSTLVSVGIVLGPAIGGIILDLASWHWIFLVNLPIGIAAVVLAIIYLPNFQPVGDQRFDYAGAITLFIALLALLMGMTLGPEMRFDNPLIVALLIGGVIFSIAFVMIELRVDQPMIELRLFRNSIFSSDLFIRLLSFIGISGLSLLMPFYLEIVRGYDPRQVGLLLAVTPIGIGLSSPFSGTLSDRLGTRLISFIGLIILALGYYAVSTLDAETSLLGYILRSAPVGFGMGIFQSPNNSSVMGSVPRDRYGIASGLLSITRTLGSTAGVAVLGAIWASRVFARAEGPRPEGAIDAPIPLQMAGLQDTFLLVAIMIGVGVIISLWTLRRAKETQARPVTVTR